MFCVGLFTALECKSFCICDGEVNSMAAASFVVLEPQVVDIMAKMGTLILGLKAADIPLKSPHLGGSPVSSLLQLIYRAFIVVSCVSLAEGGLKDVNIRG